MRIVVDTNVLFRNSFSKTSLIKKNQNMHCFKCGFSQYCTKNNAIFAIFVKTIKNKLWIPYCRHIG